MARIKKGSTHFIQDVVRLFSEKSRLVTAVPGFEPRAQQQQLSKQMAEAIQGVSTLIAEAGTGTGKTFAYLVPVLLSGKKAVISTATKMLQDQLVQKDLPLLMRALGLGIRVQNLKGRSNYLCEYRIRLFSEETRFVDRQTAMSLTTVRERFSQLNEGVREELPELQEDDPVWPYATSTSENCLSGKCPHLQSCFLVKARRRALEADLVVINHHLFFADVRLKEQGFGSLLPGVQVLVFDEAHQLADIASDFYAQRFSTRMLSDALADLRRAWPVVCPWHEKVIQSELEIERIMEMIKLMCQDKGRFRFSAVSQQPLFQEAWRDLSIKLAVLIAYFEASGWLKNDTYPALHQLFSRFDMLLTLIQRFEKPSAGYIAWGEMHKIHVVFYLTPVHVAPLFQQSLPNPAVTAIYTSATLSVGASFDAFMAQLGLQDEKTLLMPSPFDFQKQALLYLPRGLPDPKHPHYQTRLLDSMVPVLEACQGRSFFLFTSHEALNNMAARIQSKLSFPILVQGRESKSILLAKFKALGNAILLGTATFWEGVDVKGQALSCVIIDKLPFMSPFDPLMQGKLSYFEQLGQSGFDVYTLPAAVIALKQGVGRLIRDMQDKGIVVIADPRLTARQYGEVIFSSLPPFRKTRELQKVLTFVETMDSTTAPEKP